MRSATCALCLILCCLLLKNVQGAKKKNNAEESENDNKIGNQVKQFDKTEKQKLNSYDKGTNSIKNKVIKNNGKEGKNNNKNKNTDNSSEETTEIQEFQKNKNPKIKQNKDPDEKVFFTKVKKANHVIKHYRKVKIDQDSEDDNSESEEDIKRQEKQSNEKFNKKIGSSKRNNQNKDDFTDHKQKICKKSKNGEGCNDSDEDNSDHKQYSEEEDEKSFQPTIKYSIKFKHEKEKNKAAKKENLSILRLHRKRGKNKDDDDLSSEEDDAPFQKKNIFAHTDDD